MDTCLVLGAGPLLGRSLARRFGHGGHPVAVVARSGEALDELAAELRADGIDALALPADLGDPAALADAVTAAREQLGPIGVLIYNAAALGVRARPSELGLETLLSTLRVNLFGAVLAVQHAAPDMVRAGRGTVLFTLGTYAQRPEAEFAAVGIGKAALRNFAASCVQEFEPQGIHVASVTVSGVIAPGTRFDPDTLAETFWTVHRQPPHLWDHDIMS